MAGPIDPDRIDISLDLVGEGSLAAVEQLTEQLSRVTEHLSQFGRSDFGSAQAQQSMGSRFRNGTGVNEGGPSRGASLPQGMNPGDGHGLMGSYPDEGTFSRLRRYARMRPGQAIQEEVAHYNARERDQHARRALNGMPDYDLSGVGGTGGYGYDFGNSYIGSYVDGGNYQSGVSRGASVPSGPGGPSGQPMWRNALQANPTAWEQAQEGVRLPPGGLSMNIQDKLRLASNALAGSANRSFLGDVQASRAAALEEAQSLGYSPEEFANMADDLDYSGSGLRRGNAATLLRAASESNLLVGAQAVGHDVRRLGGRAYAYTSGLQQAGTEAGYSRAGQINIPGTNIGITNPLNLLRGGSAFREGLNQRVNVQRLRMMGGINRDQANQIVGSLAGSGWTGEEGQDLAFNAIAPLVQQGLNPEVTTSMLDQAIRNGNTPVQDFVDTMKDLGPAARAARMSLTEYQESLNDFAEWAKNNGATYNQGLQLGRGVSSSLGIAPQVAQSMMTSPLVQAMGVGQGLLPNELGLMGTNQSVTSVMGALNLAEKATQNFVGQDIRDPVTGHIITGTQRQNAQIATILGGESAGFTPETVARLRRQSGVSTAAARVTDRLDQYHDTAKAVGSVTPQMTRGTIKAGDWVVVPPDIASMRKQQGRSVRQVGNQYYMQVSGDNTSDTGVLIGQQGAKLNLAGVQAAKDLAHGSGSSWDVVEKSLTDFQKAGGWGKDSKFADRLHDIEKMDPGKRTNAARDLINDYMRKVAAPSTDTRPKVQVEFTGLAKRYFQQKDNDPKDTANRGGDPISSYATGPAAPRTKMQDFLNGG